MLRIRKVPPAEAQAAELPSPFHHRPQRGNTQPPGPRSTPRQPLRPDRKDAQIERLVRGHQRPSQHTQRRPDDMPGKYAHPVGHDAEVKYPQRHAVPERRPLIPKRELREERYQPDPRQPPPVQMRQRSGEKQAGHGGEEYPPRPNSRLPEQGRRDAACRALFSCCTLRIAS